MSTTTLDALVSARAVERAMHLAHGEVRRAADAGEIPCVRRKPRRGAVGIYVSAADANRKWGVPRA